MSPLRRATLRATVFCSALTTVYWGVFSLVGEVGASPVAQWMLYAACLSSWCWVAMHRSANTTTAPLTWLSYAGQSVVLALLFLGADAGRDALFGPDRLKTSVPAWLGGLELRWILCPGVASVALAAAAAQVVDRAWRHAAEDSS